MKKSKLSLGLVTAFITTMAMTGCSSGVVAKDKALISFEGYNGVKYDIVTDEMYKNYVVNASGISDFYDKILEVLIRYQMKDAATKPETEKSYEIIEKEAINNVDAQKRTAQANKDKNGTQYDAEWDAILTSFGVENEQELLEHFIYQGEKTQLENWFIDQNLETLTKEFIGIQETGENAGKAVSGYKDLVSRLPYHIRHILVKIDDGGSNYTTGTISEKQAIALHDIVTDLAKGNETFGQIAFAQSEDTSNENYGDVGIMNNKASEDGSLSMFPEFQLGIYAYDALVKNKNKDYTAIKDGLGLTYEVRESAAKLTGNGSTTVTDIAGLSEVPFNVFLDLRKEIASLEASADGFEVSNGNAVLYPRNVIYNRYLNHHNPFIITNAARKDYNSLITDLANVDALGNTVNPNAKVEGVIDYSSVDGIAVITDPADRRTGFRSAKMLGLSNDESKLILTDENSNVIIGVRSASGGIHFIVVQKSIFDINDGQDDNVSLAQYYTAKVPGEDGYPKDAAGNDKNTYVNFINSSDKGVYTSRASELKSAIKSFDPTYQYRLYEYLTDGHLGELKFNAEIDLSKEIKNYVDRQRESNAVSQKIGMSKAWDKYFELIAAQNEMREIKEDDKYVRVVPEGCVIGFAKELEKYKNSSNPAEQELYRKYTKGGMCYYGK